MVVVVEASPSFCTLLLLASRSLGLLGRRLPLRLLFPTALPPKRRRRTRILVSQQPRRVRIGHGRCAGGGLLRTLLGRALFGIRIGSGGLLRIPFGYTVRRIRAGVGGSAGALFRHYRILDKLTDGFSGAGHDATVGVPSVSIEIK